MSTGLEEITEGVFKHKTAVIDVEYLSAGRGTVINAYARVFGTRVSLGRETWVDQYAVIGGGSAYDTVAALDAGDWLHLGLYSQINIARGVRVGHEVGIGIGTRLFTHGAYLSEWEGFPVSFSGITMGSRVWLPNAQVNPGSTIGQDVVVAAGSVVSGDLPTGSLAAGAPAKVVREGAFPRKLSLEQQRAFCGNFLRECSSLYGLEIETDGRGTFTVHGTHFHVATRRISGLVSPETEKVRNQLRRRGIRFRYDAPANGEAYVPWS